MSRRRAASPGARSSRSRSKPPTKRDGVDASANGWSGWDEYAPFYDWENARTFGRRDVAFWRSIVARTSGRVLELGCGTGRVSVPLVRTGIPLVGVDRSAAMLDRAAARARRVAVGRPARSRASLSLVRADIRALPFCDGTFQTVLAPYGMLQSLTREADLRATLLSVARILRAGGLFGIDLVPDVPNWSEYSEKIQLRGRSSGGRHLTLIESVHQDRRRRLTTFRQRYLERRGESTTEHCFDLTFRTLPVDDVAQRLRGAGFDVEALMGDYDGGRWHRRADAWIILARRRRGAKPEC